MKKTLLLSIIAIIPFLVFSQISTSKDFSYTTSNPYKVIDSQTKIYLSYKSDIYMIKKVKKIIIIQKFNSETLEEIYRKEAVGLPENFTFENVAIINNKLYFFYSLWDKENQLEQLFSREIDFEIGDFVGEAKFLFKVNGKVTDAIPSSGVNFTYTYDKFNFNFSYDSTKIMVQYRKKPEIKKDALNYDVIGFYVFDNNLEQLWNKEVKMPYTEKKMDNIDYAIDAEGNPYILSIVYDDNSSKMKKNKEGEANYHVELLRVNSTSDDIDKASVDVGNNFINKIYLYESPKNYMVCAGLYNNGSAKIGFFNSYVDNDANTDGIFIFKARKEGEIFDLAFYEIPVEVLNQYEKLSTQKKNDKKDKKGKADFANLELHNMIIGADGSIVLVGEQLYSVTTTTVTSSPQGGTSTHSKTTYYANDMLVTKIDSSGKMAWMRKLPKKQLSAKGFNSISFKYINANDAHYVVFLDNLKNMNLSLNKRPAQHVDGKGGFLTAYKVDDTNGEVAKLSLFDIKNVNGTEVYQFSPHRIFSISPTEFAVEVYKKKKEDVLIKITLGSE